MTEQTGDGLLRRAEATVRETARLYREAANCTGVPAISELLNQLAEQTLHPSEQRASDTTSDRPALAELLRDALGRERSLIDALLAVEQRMGGRPAEAEIQGVAAQKADDACMPEAGLQEVPDTPSATEPSNAAKAPGLDRADGASAEASRVFRGIVANLPLAIYVTSGIEQICGYTNPAFGELFGYTQKEIPSIAEWWPLAYPDETYREQVSREWTSRVAKALDSQTSIEPMETTVTCSDGSTKLIRWGYVAIGEKSFAYGLDLTDSRRAQEAKARLAEQAWQLMKAESLGRMAGAIAHLLGNHLQAVVGNLELARQGSTDDASMADRLDDALLATGKAAQVSDLMRAYVGQTVTDRGPLDLAETCRAWLPALEAASPRKIAMLDQLESSGPVVLGSASELQYVLTTLVSNSWEAIGEKGGEVRVALHTAPAAEMASGQLFPIGFARQDDEYACLEVQDTGCGIAEPGLRKLFDPFYTTKAAGRGMGLAAVLGIVRAHGGAITVASQLGTGSTFRVFLPLHRGGRPAEQSQARDQAAPAGNAVLVVEDEPALRKLMEAMLGRLGVDVLLAKDGIEALETFQRHREEIGLVICDVMMPRLDGWGTLNALRESSPGIRVIFSSGHSEREVLGGNHPESPDLFLTKPYSWARLHQAVRRFLPCAGSDETP